MWRKCADHKTMSRTMSLSLCCATKPIRLVLIDFWLFFLRWPHRVVMFTKIIINNFLLFSFFFFYLRKTAFTFLGLENVSGPPRVFSFLEVYSSKKVLKEGPFSTYSVRQEVLYYFSLRQGAEASRLGWKVWLDSHAIQFFSRQVLAVFSRKPDLPFYSTSI